MPPFTPALTGVAEGLATIIKGALSAVSQNVQLFLKYQSNREDGAVSKLIVH